MNHKLSQNFISSLTHVHLHKRCGDRKYDLKGGPLLVEKRNAFMQFHRIRFNAWKSYLLTKKNVLGKENTEKK